MLLEFFTTMAALPGLVLVRCPSVQSQLEPDVIYFFNNQKYIPLPMIVHFFFIVRKIYDVSVIG